LLVADEITEALDLDCLLFVPASEPPHKAVADLAPARDRFEMTKLAIAGHPRFEPCDLEIGRPGPSYTVDTLTALQTRGDLHLVIGSETFLDLLSWRDPVKVARLARLVVVPRSGTGFDPGAPAALAVLSDLRLPGFARLGEEASAASTPQAPLLVHASSLPISASDLRRRARMGRSLAYRLPDSVAAYIRDRRLYRTAP
jgi:nicotinate-nucleotide adenylyltransferase